MGPGERQAEPGTAPPPVFLLRPVGSPGNEGAGVGSMWRLTKTPGLGGGAAGARRAGRCQCGASGWAGPAAGGAEKRNSRVSEKTVPSLCAPHPPTLGGKVGLGWEQAEAAAFPCWGLSGWGAAGRLRQETQPPWGRAGPGLHGAPACPAKPRRRWPSPSASLKILGERDEGPHEGEQLGECQGRSGGSGRRTAVCGAGSPAWALPCRHGAHLFAVPFRPLRPPSSHIPEPAGAQEALKLGRWPLQRRCGPWGLLGDRDPHSGCPWQGFLQPWAGSLETQWGRCSRLHHRQARLPCLSQECPQRRSGVHRATAPL